MKRKLPRHKLRLSLIGYFVPGQPFRAAYTVAWFRGVERRGRSGEKQR